QRRFDELARGDEDRRRLRALAERQDELAARAEALAAAGDRERLEPVRQEQERLRNETDDLLRRAPALRAEALADQGRRAAALAERRKPLSERQEAIALLAAAIPVDEPRRGPAHDVARATGQAADDLRRPRPRQAPGHQDEAAGALHRLADALPDADQGRQ